METMTVKRYGKLVVTNEYKSGKWHMCTCSRSSKK